LAREDFKDHEKAESREQGAESREQRAGARTNKID
jgi:hypothetical protein